MKEKGYAMVIVMVFSLLFSLWVTSAVESSLISFHRTKNYIERTRQFYAAETALCEIEKQLNQGNVDLEGKLNYSEFDIKYHVQPLEIDPCAILLSEKEALAQYYRIEVTANNKNTGVTTSLETTEILPLSHRKVKAICQMTPRVVNKGRQSWREI